MSPFKCVDLFLIFNKINIHDKYTFLPTHYKKNTVDLSALKAQSKKQVDDNSCLSKTTHKKGLFF